MVAKTTRITIETQSLLVVHRGKTMVTWCPVCCVQVEAMTLEGASLGDGLPSALLREWLATGKLHFWGPDDGPAQICLTSLLQCLECQVAGRLPEAKQTFPKTGE
jgi:hypothetical protein